MAKTTKYTSTIDDRFSSFDGKSVFGNGSTPITAYTNTSPKFVQGVAYLQSNNHLKIDIRSNMRYEYDRVATVVDHDYVSGIDFDYESDGKILITYKNWTKRQASSKTLTLQFISGFKKTIVLKVPGLASKLNDDVENTIASFTTSPYENMMSLDFSNDKRSINSIVGAVYPKQDPYDVYNYTGTYQLNLPFAYYINSSYLNEIFVEQGVTSTNNDVDNGISNRGVGHLYSGRNEQEIHFVNLLTTNTNLGTNQDVLNNLNTAPFTYGFTYASNLYFIADDAQEYQVCMEPGNPSFFLTSGNDCDGTTIGTPYTNKRFVDGHCCNSGCDDFSITVENTSPEQRDAANTNGSILVTVTGGTANYTYVLTKFGATGAGTEVSSGAKSGTTHSFTSLIRQDSNIKPYLVTVTDGTSCVKTVHISLQTKINQEEITSGVCTDNSAANYDNAGYIVNKDATCFFCMENDAYGNPYNGLTYGDDDNGHNRAVGVDFVANSGSVVSHATGSGSTSGYIQFSGELFPPLADHIASDANEAYKLKLHTLGSGENANNKTKAEILALTATSTVAVDANFQYTFAGLAKGWYAIEAYVEEVPNVANCKSVHRFQIGYGGCTDRNANNYDPNATYHVQNICKYNCSEDSVNIISNDTNQACVKSLSIGRGSYDVINWVIGGERKQGFGPHLASEGDYVEVMVENTQTKCTQRGAMHITETDCNRNISATSRMLIMQETAAMGGCTDQTAANYNCDAEWDNGSCIPVLLGCTDMSAANYNPDANIDNGQCVYGILGCTNSLALNYNPLATIADNESCDTCPVFGDTGGGYSNLGLLTFDGALSGSDLTSAIQAGTFDIYATGDLIFTWSTFTIIGGYVNYLPAGVEINIYKLPMGAGTINGNSINDYQFPIKEKMDITPDGYGKVTGLDSPNYNNPLFGTWNADGSLNPGTVSAWTMVQPLEYGTGEYGYYIVEMVIPAGDGKFCYNYNSQGQIINDNSGATSVSFGYSLNSNDPSVQYYDVNGISSYLANDVIGCVDKYASNYTGAGIGSINLVYLIQQGTSNTPAQAGDFYVNQPMLDQPEVFGMCTFSANQPECLPLNKTQKEKYLTDCTYNGVGNWYTRLLGGSKDNCEDRNIMIMSFIKYLVSKNGLDCIHNCADSATPNYPEKKTCEDIWKEGGSIEWTQTNNTGQGNGSYGTNAYIKMTTQFPWLGDQAPNTIHKVNNNCGSNCGNPYGTGFSNFDICIDPKIITENTNYLDKFYKFASDYCKSCSPCSYLVGNSNSVIGSNVNTTEPYTYNIVDNGIQVGGINLEVDGDDVTITDEGP
tara:strand:- start:1145 stop:5083 length:3939 start_codon:yes stop_codon:yes gene_type:complete